jgi:hypothetical protein
MTQPRPTRPFHIFVVKNWFEWIIEAHNLGYSKADILFILDVIGVREQLKRILEDNPET